MVEEARDVKSPASICITNRNLNHILEAMLHNWCVKCIVTIGADPGPGAIEFEGVRTRDGNGQLEVENDESKWLDTTTETPPSWTHDGSKIPELDAVIQSSEPGALGRVQLVKVDDARAVAGSVARKAVNEYEAKLRAQMTAQGGSYRCWLMMQASKKLMAVELANAYDDIGKAVMGRTKRVGVQCISTRRKKLPSYGGFQFSGKFAFRQFQGRPLLPSAEWLRRYRKRRAKLKAKTKPKPKLKAPATKSPRPDTAQAKAAIMAADPKPVGKPPLSSKQWLERYRARKAKWNGSRTKGQKRKPMEAPKQKHERPPHMLNLKCGVKRAEIYAPNGADLADYFQSEELNPEQELA